MMFIPILLLILLFFYFDPRDRRGGHGYGYHDDREENSALDILDRRFAEGDISEEEYLKRKTLLRPRK